MNYNKSQQQAIRHKDGPMLVLAGPGSGKTAVITQRTKQLIEYENIDPSNILVITFTRAAAQEMKQRFLAATGEERTKVTFGTFHAIFFMVLKLAYHFDSGNIISEEQRYQFMREILSYHHLEYRDEGEFIGDVLTEISRVKNEQIPLEHFYSSSCGEEVFRKIYREYDERLKRNRLIDFDDMLTYTYELFSQRKDILSAWQKKYRYILIDEFQDINLIQWKIMCMLAAPENNLFVVGDDDQSIYRFRGSKPEIMLGFQKIYPQAKIVNLEVNYRCEPPIVEAAMRLIAHNEERFPKKIRAGKSGKQKVRFQYFEDCYKENAFLAEDIRQTVQNGVPLSEIAVLFRTNMQPRALMEYMVSANLAFQTKDRIPDIYEHWIARDFFTYIRIAQGSDSRADFLSIMNRPKRYIGRDSLPDETVCFDEWMKLYEEQPWIAERIEKLWYDLKHLSRLSPYAAINYIRRGIGYDDYLAEYAEYRNANKEDFYEVADEILASAKGYRTFEEWFAHIEEYRQELKRLAQEKRRNQNAVTFATLHSAKGLEFPVCILAGAGRKYNMQDLTGKMLLHPQLGLATKCHQEEGYFDYPTLPLEVVKRESRLAAMSENLRVLYVAMTRAKSQFISFASVRSLESRVKTLAAYLQQGKPLPHLCSKLLYDSDFLLMSALCHPDGGALREMATVEVPVHAPTTVPTASDSRASFMLGILPSLSVMPAREAVPTSVPMVSNISIMQKVMIRLIAVNQPMLKKSAKSNLNSVVSTIS